MSRVSLKSDIEQRQYENMEQLRRMTVKSDESNGGGNLGGRCRAPPPDVFIDTQTWVNVLTRTAEKF